MNCLNLYRPIRTNFEKLELKNFSIGQIHILKEVIAQVSVFPQQKLSSQKRVFI